MFILAIRWANCYLYYYSQKKTLPQLKKTHPWYGEIYSQVLQDVVKRVKVTFDRFLKGDSNGKRSGKPRFKARNRYRTFTYPQMKDGCWQANLINLPMFGKVKGNCSPQLCGGEQTEPKLESAKIQAG